MNREQRNRYMANRRRQQRTVKHGKFVLRGGPYDGQVWLASWMTRGTLPFRVGDYVGYYDDQLQWRNTREY